MRIWHEKLIKKLCRQHLLSMWRESWGCFIILKENKQGYSNHPQVKEFKGNLGCLCARLLLVRREMIKRGYKPKKLPNMPKIENKQLYKRWQSLEKQIRVLKFKKCDCKI